MTDVLLVHPQVEHPNQHEVAVGAGPRGRPGLRIEPVGSELFQCLSAIGQRLGQFGPNLCGCVVAPQFDRCLDHGREVVVDMSEVGHRRGVLSET